MLVSTEVKNAFSLNKKEMERRRFLLKKSGITLNEKEIRELEILNLRCYLYTSEDIKNAISLIKKDLNNE